MRYVIIIIIGIAIGALSAFSLANMLNKQNAWGRGVMTVMAHEMGALKDAVKANNCSDIGDTLMRLRLVSERIEPAMMPPPATDKIFSKHADDLHQAIAAVQASGGDCQILAAGMEKIKDVCSACHRDYR